MTKRQLKKSAREKIVLQGKTHRETFEELKGTPGFSQTEIADELAKVPSQIKREQNRILQWIYIGAVCLIVLLRLLGIVTIGQELNGAALLLLLAIGFLVPGIAIFSAVTYRMDAYRSVAILFILSVVRSFRQLDVTDPISLVVLAIHVVAIGLAFWIPERMKTPYTSSVSVVIDEEGKQRRVTEIVFPDSAAAERGDLLDSGI